VHVDVESDVEQAVIFAALIEPAAVDEGFAVNVPLMAMPPLESAGRKPPRLAQAGPSFVRTDSSGIPLSGMSQSARAAPGTAARPTASMPPSAKARIVLPADSIGRISGLFIFLAPQTGFQSSIRFVLALVPLSPGLLSGVRSGVML